MNLHKLTLALKNLNKITLKTGFGKVLKPSRKKEFLFVKIKAKNSKNYKKKAMK